MIKRLAQWTIALLLFVPTLGGCASNTDTQLADEDGKLNVVTSFYPLYDFAREIGGDRINAVNLTPTGVEPHDWTPKSQDMVNISRANMFIYQGAGFEGWTSEVLDGIDTSKMVLTEASRGIELLEVDPHDSHEAEQGSGEEHGHEYEHDDTGYDPHTWLSPKSALRMADNILNGLKLADPDHASEYERNYAELADRLQSLDRQYEERLSSAARKEIVVSHQAFGYLARDYGLTQMPIMGISAEAEPTAQKLKEISGFVQAHQVRYIFTEQLVSDALATTLAEDLGVTTLTLHTLEGLTDEELNNGENYISIMEKNLETLMTALQ